MTSLGLGVSCCSRLLLLLGLILILCQLATATSLHSLNFFPPQLPLVTIPSSSRHLSLHTRSLDHATAADGTSPSRVALSSLFFSIPTIILGLTLLLVGRALPRFVASFGIAAAIALPTWALSVNLASGDGFIARSHNDANQNILIWGLVAGSLLLGITLSLLIGQYAYRFGVYLLSIEAGLAIAISILIFSSELTIHHSLFRWIFLVLSACLFGLVTIFCRPSISLSLACTSSGAFLLFLGIDLLAKENDGMSRGIRFLFDHNPHHSQDLANYNPPTVTRILLPLSWASMLLGASYQYKFLDRPFDTAWLPDLHRKPSGSSAQSTVLIDHDTEKNEAADKALSANSASSNGVSADSASSNGVSANSASSHEDQLSSPAHLDNPPFPASPQPHEFESPSQSEQRYTTDSLETGLSAIPEVTEHSTSGRGGSRSGSGSGRGISVTFPHSHRHPSNATSNSFRRSTRSSEFQVPLPPSISAPADPSNISVSPPRTILSETTVFPDDSISQATRQRLGLTIYNSSGLIEEETEAMLTPSTDPISPVEEDSRQTVGSEGPGDTHFSPNPRPLIEDSPTPGSTGLLTRIAHAFGDGSSSMSRPDLQQTPQRYQYGEQASEEQALQSDARRWASLSEGQPPYEHTGRLRRDLHSWTSDEPT
ncbi:hypothetical protein PCASD_08569 [Puccinia coronata f. sp. avenae]|uniref:TM7S3/TM198-like domain-containing protein n=1 Tax=Puccinia coronata f. sp. avenae TaxID=200324 RepID=A0A2N5UR76_9BASI|nr:hypothetical protein PCASD_08569 [Puccinia coronata f. sp. avenae]